MYLVFKGVLSPKFEIVKAKNETKNFPAKVSFLPDVDMIIIHDSTPEIVNMAIQMFRTYFSELTMYETDTLPHSLESQFQQMLNNASEESLAKFEEFCKEYSGNEIVITTVSNNVIKSSNASEKAILKHFGYAFKALDSSKPVDEQIPVFLRKMKMDFTSDLLIDTFKIVRNQSTINYTRLSKDLKKIYPDCPEISINRKLKKFSLQWLSKHPELNSKQNHVSLTTVLKLFDQAFS